MTSVALVASLGLVGCSGGDDDAAPESPSSTTSPTDNSSTADAQQLEKSNAELKAHIIQIGPGVKHKQQSHITRQISRTLQAWTDAAYLGGGFPHGGYTRKDLRGWTPQAAALAMGDKSVTTNDALRNRAVRVVANRRDARLFVFTVHGRTGGATAKVFLSMTAELESGRPMRYAVAGQVYLTRKANSWRIFGYDLHRTVFHR